MTSRRHIEGLLAQSLYEPLAPRDAARLEQALAADPALRAEAEAMAALAGRIPAASPPFEGDLLPAVRAELAETPAAAPGRRMVFFAAGCIVMAGLFAAALYRGAAPAPAPVQTAARPAASPVAQAMAAAAGHAEQGDYTAAFESLARTLEAHPGDAAAPDAELMLADLAYNELAWFDEAAGRYAAYRRSHRGEFAAHPRRVEIASRIELLNEQADDGHQGLFALRQAAEQGDLEAFESIMAEHPDTLLAAQAVEELGVTLLRSGDATSDTLMQALDEVRGQFEHPVARGQLALGLGDLSFERLNDRVQAERYYSDAAASGDPALARAAQRRLTDLNGAGER